MGLGNLWEGLREWISVSWYFEIAFAIAILFFEGTLHFLWPIGRNLLFWVRWVTPVLKKYPDSDLLEAGVIEITKAYGFKIEEHYVETKDGYILGLYRICLKNEAPTRGSVLLMHGFLTCCEAWLARFPNKALPYLLAKEGFDVWLGNNRGSKYSYKHLKYKATEEAFWNFCLDDLARYDIPAFVNYILHCTSASQLSYIGFSQGTAQGFAAFSSQPELASKIRMFVALAPVTGLRRLENPVVEGVSSSRPEFLYLLFGKKIMLAQTLFWRRVLTTNLYVKAIDMSMKFLFGWDTKSLDPLEKPLMYSHLYSYSSVKTVVQWFQIMKTGKFQQYDDHVHPESQKYQTYKLPSYNIFKVPCKIALFWGGRDTLPVMDDLLKLPNAFIHCEREYEHLDFLFAKNAAERIYFQVIELLKS